MNERIAPYFTDRQLLDELIRRNESRLEEPVVWCRFKDLRKLLFDAGKIIVQFEGRDKKK